VLDEPTNDLDIETLELVEAQLAEYPGTLLVVSHDRQFLNNVVTSTFVFEGDGRVQEYVGGYDDWLQQRGAALAAETAVVAEHTPRAASRPAIEPVEAPRPKPAPPRKLSFNEKRELLELPLRIEALEAEQHALHARVQGPEFYKEGASAIAQALGRLEQIKTELDRAYARWGELESRGA
jgi:ATP-binding cassette subfamily F protein uup